MKDEEYDKIVLSEEETKAAILEGKKKKYFHLQHEEYWKSAEGVKAMKRVKVIAKQFGLI